MPVSIRTERLTKTYGEVIALKDISLEITRGELFGLIGPDGSGKTSLFRILATLLIPDEGKAWVENLDTRKDYKKIRKITGYMPGRFSLYQDLSVEENLNFYASIFNASIKENYDLIRDIYIQIEPFKKRLAGRLSGGMKQKLALSCALIHKPQVLLLDEPTTGVDAVSRQEFWEMLKKLQEKGITIVVSTPYMDEASLCDRVAFIQKGTLLQVDQPQHIVEGFNRPIAAISADNMYDLVNDLRAYPGADTAFRFGDVIHLTTKGNDIKTNDIHGFLDARGYHDVEIEHITPDIEDCFMALMKEE